MPPTAQRRSQSPLPFRMNCAPIAASPSGQPMSTYAMWPVANAGTITSGKKIAACTAAFTSSHGAHDARAPEERQRQQRDQQLLELGELRGQHGSDRWPAGDLCIHTFCSRRGAGSRHTKCKSRQRLSSHLDRRADLGRDLDRCEAEQRCGARCSSPLRRSRTCASLRRRGRHSSECSNSPRRPSECSNRPRRRQHCRH